MAINIQPPIDMKEEDVSISHADAELIRRIATGIGKIEAIRVTRWLTKAGIRTSKDFVEKLCEEHA